MDLGLTGQTAFVSASSRGIGLAVAKALAQEGAKVAICGRDKKRLEEAHRQVVAQGGQCFSVQVNLEDDDGPFTFCSRASEALGEPHILVINTGYPRPCYFEETTAHDFEKASRTLLFPVQGLLRFCVPAMKKRGYGRVVAIVSIAAKAPIPSIVLSNAIRPGVLGLMKSLATELAPHGVTVNSVCPGYHRTERLYSLAVEKAKASGKDPEDVLKEMAIEVPMGRLGLPEELARFVTFLCSPVCSYLTGAVIQVDGGLYHGLI